MPLPRAEQEQIRAAQEGSSGAWDALFRTWCPVVVGWCRYLGSGTIDPEEAAHEVFIRLHRRFDALDSAAVFRSFLYGITRRVVAEHRRRLWWQRWLPGPVVPRPDPRPDPERQLVLTEATARVDALLDRIPVAFREVLILCDVEGYALAEVAELLGVPTGTIKSRLSRGRARFKDEAARCGLTLATALVEEAHG